MKDIALSGTYLSSFSRVAFLVRKVRGPRPFSRVAFLGGGDRLPLFFKRQGVTPFFFFELKARSFFLRGFPGR